MLPITPKTELTNPKIIDNATNIDFDESVDFDFELVAKKYSPKNFLKFKN